MQTLGGQQLHGVPRPGQQPRGASTELVTFLTQGHCPLQALPVVTTDLDTYTCLGFHFLICRMERLGVTTRLFQNQGKRAVNPKASKKPRLL